MAVLMLLFGTLLFVFNHDYVESACCYSCRSHCNDCSGPTPYCGYGKCNFFGCKCECRRGPGCLNCGWGKRSIGEEHGVSNVTIESTKQQIEQDTKMHLDKLFAEFDKNKNGVLEFSEAQEWGLKHHAITKRDVHKVMLEFSKTDLNNDGKISRDELGK